jgi:hypothetical protein
MHTPSDTNHRVCELVADLRSYLTTSLTLGCHGGALSLYAAWDRDRAALARLVRHE